MPHKEKVSLRLSGVISGKAISQLNWPSPARRALIASGYLRLEQLTKVSEVEALKMHGMGPRALDQIRCALAARGPLADGKRKKGRGDG